MELHCLAWHPRAAKALIAAKHGGVDLKVVDVQWPTQNRSAEYLKINPLGKARACSRCTHRHIGRHNTSRASRATAVRRMSSQPCGRAWCEACCEEHCVACRSQCSRHQTVASLRPTLSLATVRLAAATLIFSVLRI